jgi:hypothetical protein
VIETTGRQALDFGRRITAEPRALGRFSGETVFVVGAIVAQWIAVALLAVAATHNGWLYYQGGDQTFFYTIAWVISHGQLPETGIGYSWSMVETPIAGAAGPSFLVGLPAIVLVQVLILLPLAVAALYGMSKRLLGARIARVAVAAWILVPFAVIPLFVQRYHARWVDQTLPQSMGLTGMGDFAAMVLLLCGAYLIFRHFDEDGWETAVVAGLVVGFSIGLKPSGGLFLVAPAIGFLLARRFRGLVAFGLALLPSLLALTIWKERGLGQVPLFHSTAGTVTLAAGAQVAVDHVAALNLNRYLKFDWAHLQNNLDGIREYFWSDRLVEWIPIAGLIGALRVSRAKGVFLGVWLAMFFLFKGSNALASVDTGSFWRFLLPAWPAYLLLGTSILAIVPTLGRRLHPAPVTVAKRSLRWETYAAFALLGILPLVYVSAVPRRGDYLAVRDNARNLYVPVDRTFHVAAKVADKAVSLSWPDPGSGSVKPAYLVLRVPAGTTTDDGVNCGPRPGGVPPCVIAMPELGYTPERSFVDHPGRGRWIYRVAIAASYTADPNGGDPLLYSGPTEVTVRR